MSDILTADLLLSGYAQGIFPMAEGRETSELHWFEPKWRGVIPLDRFHISRSLAKLIRQERYSVRVNTAFHETVERCAARPETWINDALFSLYAKLHQENFAHSVEIWEGNSLVGGVFGIVLGGAFFGESMFSSRKNTSKLALAYAVDRLNAAGFALFDTQYLTPHLASLGGIEISRTVYKKQLATALVTPHRDFGTIVIPSGHQLLQRMTQTS